MNKIGKLAICVSAALLMGAGMSSARTVYVEKSKGHNYVAPHESVIAFSSNGLVRSFDATATVLIPENENSNRVHKPGCYLMIWTDGKLAWKSDLICSSDAPVNIHVDLTGAKEIILETASAGPWHPVTESTATWAGARFDCGKGAKIEKITDPKTYQQLGVLTPAEDPAPKFNGADIWGVHPGHPVIFKVPVSGERPMRFKAENLPEGVTFDSEKGIIGGTAPMQKGSYDIIVTAENSKGIAQKAIRLEVGDILALTPPMGWNSWNIWGYMLTADHVKESADALDKSGLANYGWSYINLDDWWEKNNSGVQRVKDREKELGAGNVTGIARNADGTILPNRSFPDMKDLTDYVHSYGYKIGLYSSPGPLTCGKCEGSYGHEMQDATSWAEWGFDYIKYDWCSYSQIYDAEKNDTPEKIREGHIRPYKLMYDCLKQQNRDIVFSYCQYGNEETQEWARENGANCWRSWDDLKDGWTWMLQAVESHINGEYWKYSGPGCWADPDMLTIGEQRSHGSVHPTCLSNNEQYTHVSLWAMVGAPLLIGCDLTKLDDFTRSLLTNSEVIAISQDRLGKVARRYVNTETESVWARPLANGDWAVAIVNLYPVTREVRVNLSELGIKGQCSIHNCWSQKDEGQASGVIAKEVPAHATLLYRVSTNLCNKCE